MQRPAGRALIGLVSLTLMTVAASSHGVPAPIPADSGRSLGGFVIPVEPRDGECSLTSLRAWRWRTDDTQRLLLEGDVLVDIAGWTFEASRALVWIDRVSTEPSDVTQIAIFLPQTRPGLQPSTGTARGRNLLVVGTIRGRTLLDTALIKDGPPPAGTPVLTQGEARLARYVASVRADPPLLATHPTTTPDDAVRASDADPLLRGHRRTSTPAPWLRQLGATVGFSADSVELGGGETDATIIAQGAVALEYRPVPGPDRYGRMRLTAERAVIFMEPGTLDDLASRDLSVDDIRGVYLEGGVTAVAERDDYEVRAPRMYYDFQQDRAIMLDAVLRTYDRKRRAPVIARADELRQLAEHQWSVKNVRISASSFAVPTLALASKEAIITRIPATIDEQGQAVGSTIEVDAKSNTIDVGGVPVFWWPRFKGGPQDIPLKGTRTGWEEYKGAVVETTWDVYALLGIDRPDGESLLLDVDGYSKRGAGAGLLWERNSVDSNTKLRLYGLADSGTQRTDAGIEQPVPTHQRYEMLWEQSSMLSPEWLVQTQLSKFSDSTFVSVWRESNFRNRREYETSAYLRWQSENMSFSLLGDYNLDDFVSNSWLLASQGFTLDEFPKASFDVFGMDILDTVTWSSSWTFSRFKANIAKGTAQDNGIPTSVFIDPATGTPIGAGQTIASALNAAGIHDKWSMRGITNHFISVPLEYGAVSVTPFASAQLQGFLQNEDDLASDANDMRAIGGAGVTVGTSMQRVWNDVEHRVLDLHRLRAILEPSFTAWYAGANFNPGSDTENPQYNPWVDDTSRGGAIRMALRSTVQTMRGGPGQWFDVDVLKMEVGAVLSRGQSQRRYPTAQWFQSNPLYSQLGNFADGRLRWQLGEGVSVISEGVWDFDSNFFTRGSAGIQLQHSPRFNTSAEFRYIEVPDSFLALNPGALKAARGELLAFRAQYEVGDLYDINIAPIWNFSENDFQSIRANVTRAFPDFDLNFYIGYDQIRGETSAGVSLGQTRF